MVWWIDLGKKQTAPGVTMRQAAAAPYTTLLSLLHKLM
jgi:hypothetical protein